MQIAGSCNAILRRPDGTLLGDMFDGAGFVRGVQRKGRQLSGARVLVVGSGGVGSAIAASFAAAGVAGIGLFDANESFVETDYTLKNLGEIGSDTKQRCSPASDTTWLPERQKDCAFL